MPIDITEADTFTASPLERPIDSDPGGLDYLTTLFQAFADRTRYLYNRATKLLGRVGGEDGSAEWIYTDGSGVAAPKTRTIVLNAAQAQTREGTGWILAYSSISGAVGLSMTSQANNANMIFPLNLPSGSIVTQIRCLWDPGATGRTNKLRAQFFRSDTFDTSLDAFAPSIATVTQTETTSPEIRSMTGLSETIDRSTRSYFVDITSGEDGSTNFDRVYSIEVTYSDPGPRNF
jgi:hypothetical protein